MYKIILNSSACPKTLQFEINLLDFQDAEPDILVHSTPAILERINQRFDVALKALCKKKGLDVEVIKISKSLPLIFQFVITGF